MELAYTFSLFPLCKQSSAPITSECPYGRYRERRSHIPLSENAGPGGRALAQRVCVSPDVTRTDDAGDDSSPGGGV